MEAKSELSKGTMPLLKTVDLIKEYKMGEITVAALKGINITVEEGEFVAIMGPSGSGKSTLLHLLGGLDTPTQGEIYLNGIALSTMSDDQITKLRRRMIGFIFQFYNLIPTLTAAENVALPLLIDGQSLQKNQERVNALLEMVGLGERGNHRPDQLSGGQQQRVAIARAFVNDPKIVLADEPTGNLDSNAGTAILELLKRTCKELQTTIIMVTHDARAASYADSVIFLKDGRIVHKLGDGGDGIARGDIMAVMAKLEI